MSEPTKPIAAPVWMALAKAMREHGVIELRFDRTGLASIRLTDAPPPPLPPGDLVLDDDPEANKLAVADLRTRLRAEIEAEQQEERDRMRFAASEGL